MKRAAILLIFTTLLPVGAARAHPGSTLTGYVSTVSAVVPNVLGVNALVLGGDDRLRISNYSGKTIVILGYEGEPYLRFDTSGVYANVRSPAAHLNRFRRQLRREQAMISTTALAANSNWLSLELT